MEFEIIPKHAIVQSELTQTESILGDSQVSILWLAIDLSIGVSLALIVYFIRDRNVFDSSISELIRHIKLIANRPELANVIIRGADAVGAKDDDDDIENSISVLLGAHLSKLDKSIERANRKASRDSLIQNIVFFLLGLTIPMILKIYFGIG